ncbi:MAG: 50S ribosomal protein L10 [Deltaproteobacteria bacterium]
MDRGGKEKIVAEMHEKLQNAKLATLAEYRGLTVEKMSVLRNVLRKSDTQLQVIKNTLLRLATKGTPTEVLGSHLKGPLAIALNGTDAVGATKALVDFAKKNPEFDIKVAVLDGKLLSKDDLQSLSELPSREVLLSKLLSVMVGVQGSFVNVLAAVPRGCVQVIDAYRIKKEQEN